MRAINLNGIRFAIPATVSDKDLQTLIGFLATLQTLDSHYDYTRSEYLHDLGRFPEIRLEVLELDLNAKAKAEASYEEYKAKQEAKKVATA